MDRISIRYVVGDAFRDLTLRVGDDLMGGAKVALLLLGKCGGKPRCGTCHVYIEERYLSFLPPMKPEELKVLEGKVTDLRRNSRLACQIIATPSLNKMQVVVGENSRVDVSSIATKDLSKKGVNVIFEIYDKRIVAATGTVGKSLLEVAQHPIYDINMPGTCGGFAACGTCHVIVDPEWIGRLPAPTEEEEDMLDTVNGVTATSRLACQITLNPSLEGLRVFVPKY